MALNKRITYDVTFREYAAAFMVFKKNIDAGILDSKLGVEKIIANSQQEAEDKILQKILVLFSVTDGYFGHKVTAIAIFNRDNFNGTE